MLCPVLEEKWIPDWKYELIHTESGVNETGCIFREDLSGFHYFEEPVTATWVTTVHDPAAKEIEFAIYYSDRAFARSSVRILKSDNGYSRVQWKKTLTLLDAASDRFPDQDLKQKVLESLTFIAESLSCYFDSCITDGPA